MPGHIPLPSFIDNPAVGGKAGFITVTVSVGLVIASWRESLFAHEWLREDGSLKSPRDQSPGLQEKRRAIEARLEQGEAFEKPVLGMGILDTVEIGSGRDVLLTLASAGVSQIPVHIPKSHLEEFRLFIKG